MRLQRSKFPFLYEREFDWYIAPNGTGEEIPFTKVAINDALHDKTLIRDYFSIVLLEKHQDLFDKMAVRMQIGAREFLLLKAKSSRSQ
ncbi:hypothetical protein [Roseivirga pacifica]